MGSENWTLVIQGPMHSPLPKRSWARDLIEDEARRTGRAPQPVVDCSAAVTKTIELARPGVQRVVLSTWSDDANASTAQKLAAGLDCDVVLSADPGRGAWPLGELPDNRQRQLLSTLVGIADVLDHGGGRIVRTRSDQVVDVAVVMAAAERDRQGAARRVGQTGFVHVAGVFATVPYAIDDFYFAGAADDLWRFFSAQWERRAAYHGADSVHTDLVLKHLWCNLAHWFELSDYECFPVVDQCRDLDHGPRPGALGTRYLDVWCEILRHSLKPLPRQVYEALVFRGLPFRRPHERLFLEEWETWGGDLRPFFLSRWPDAFGGRTFGALGALLNYAPECRWMHWPGWAGTAARAAHQARRARSGRYRTLRPEPLTA